MMSSSSSSPSTPPLVSDLVLIGGGHAHVFVLKMLGMPPRRQQLVQAGIRVTLITNTLLTPYSGMLPGYLAGHYSYEDIHLDLHQLCRFANIRLIHATAETITYEHNNHKNNNNNNSSNNNSNSTGSSCSGRITCRDAVTGELRPTVRYDCLSIDVGITPSTLPVQPQPNQQPLGDANANEKSGRFTVLPVKPIANFCIQFERLQQRVLQHFSQQSKSTTMDYGVKEEEPFTILVVGGGAGGIEVALSVQYRLHQLLLQQEQQQQQQQQPSATKSTVIDNQQQLQSSIQSKIQIIIATRGSSLLEEHNAHVQRTMRRVLQERNVQIRFHAEIVSIVQQLPQQQQTPSYQRVKTIATLASNHSTADQRNLRHHHDDNTNKSSSKSNDTSTIECDECLWCTSAVAPSWLSTRTPFSCTDVGGFVQVSSTLQCIHHPGVFAAGDCCHMTHAPRPKAGVFAVRAGPYLLHNILAHLLLDRRMRHYRPQRTFLSLMSTGNAYGIASKGPYFCMQGAWVWKWKDYIDRQFMAKFQNPTLAALHHDMMQRQVQQQQRYPSVWQSLQQLWTSLALFALSPRRSAIPKHVQIKGEHVLHAFASDPMRCGGCGAKVGSSTLSRVLAAIQQRQATRGSGRSRRNNHSKRRDVTTRKMEYDDVAVVPLPSSTGSCANMISTIDYFRSMVSDPYLFGKICAVHALSDIHAMGVSTTTVSTTVVDDDDDDGSNNNNEQQEQLDGNTQFTITALALCVVPFCADERLTESTLMDLLSGGSDVLQDEHVRLVGGHTCEGMELSCGFSIQGFVPQQHALFRKRGGKVGDKLVLTKPLGTGALLAADMRVQMKAPWIEQAMNSMLQSNGHASRIASNSARYGPQHIHACTDVTGFGLIGHLLEMLLANDVDDEDDTALRTPDDEPPPQAHHHYDSIGATITLSAVPVLQGALAASAQGIFSTLQASNYHNRHAVTNHAEAIGAGAANTGKTNVDCNKSNEHDHTIRYPLLFDPQTAGGLLFFVDPMVCDELVMELQTFYPDVSIIGELVEYKQPPKVFDNNHVVPEHVPAEAARAVGGQPSEVCTIGSAGRSTGKRIRILLQEESA